MTAPSTGIFTVSGKQPYGAPYIQVYTLALKQTITTDTAPGDELEFEFGNLSG